MGTFKTFICLQLSLLVFQSLRSFPNRTSPTSTVLWRTPCWFSHISVWAEALSTWPGTRPWPPSLSVLVSKRPMPPQARGTLWNFISRQFVFWGTLNQNVWCCGFSICSERNEPLCFAKLFEKLILISTSLCLHLPLTCTGQRDLYSLISVLTEMHDNILYEIPL